ncbi:MAG TPA: accessory gene regulator B family protein [Clostridiales bacterium]|nr:accessory gene regulator B family protein [Clostridiales bacterium]
MLHKLALKISDYFKKMNVLKVDQEIYTYGIELILSDVLNLLILFIAACVLNRILETAVWSAVFLVSRKYTGGFHAPSHFLCILTAQIGFIVSYFVCESLNPAAYIWFESIITGIGIIIPLVFGPVGSPKKPITKSFYQKKKISLSVFLIAITAVFLLIIFFFSDIKVFLYGFASYMVVIFLIPAGYIDNKIRCGYGSGVITNEN